MKKKTIVILLLLALLTVGLVPFKTQEKIAVDAQYMLVLQQLLQPQNWKNWQPALRSFAKNPSQINITRQNKTFTISAPGTVFKVDHSEGFGFMIRQKTGGKNSTEHLIALPNTTNGTSLLLVEKKNSIGRLAYDYLLKRTITSNALNLKNYLEDTRLYYGFAIRRTTVTDSNIAVIKQNVPAKNSVTAIKEIQQQLNDFIKKERLKEVQPVIAHIREPERDSVRIMIGIPVDRAFTSTLKILFMRLPPHGKMLTGVYTGRYGSRQKLYLAMQTYLSDHNLASPEEPYEKYLNNKIPLSDTSWVHLQVNFPIY